MLFSTYGPVLDVVAMKTMSMRGQAHIVFRDIHAATQAMRSLGGQQFLGRELVRTLPCLLAHCIFADDGLKQKIQYAKSKSDYIAKLDGTFKIPNLSGGAANVEQTELQQSIFNAPAPGAGLPGKPPAGADHVMKDAGSPGSRGQKRTRDDDDDESEEDVAMEEDSDDE